MTRNLGRVMAMLTLVMALGTFGVLHHLHRKHPVHAATLHHSTVPHSHHRRGGGRRSSNGLSATDDHHDTSAGHESGGTGNDPQIALLVETDLSHYFAREFVDVPATRENVLAAGSAPRAPGLTRGPPSLS